MQPPELMRILVNGEGYLCWQKKSPSLSSSERALLYDG
jgi:hypothetical protein